MRSTPKIVVIGLIWGFLEPAALFLSVLVLGIGQGGDPAELFGLDLLVGVGLGVSISFVSGIIMNDLEDIVKVLILASFITIFSLLGVIFLTPAPLYASREQTIVVVAFLGFLLLTPLFFLAEFLGGIAGVVIGGWISTEIQKRKD